MSHWRTPILLDFKGSEKEEETARDDTLANSSFQMSMKEKMLQWLQQK